MTAAFPGLSMTEMMYDDDRQQGISWDKKACEANEKG